MDHQSDAVLYISLFALSLFVVLIPYSVSVIELEKWKIDSFRSFVMSFSAINHGKTIHSQRGQREEYEPWLSTESMKIFKDATDVLYQLVSTMLNSLLSIIAIGMVIDSSLFIYYLIAGVTLILAGIFSKSRITAASGVMQNHSKDLGKSMLKAWENILTGNRYNLQNWKKGFDRSFGNLFVSASRYEKVRTILSNGVVSISLLVVVAGNARIFFDSLGITASLGALLVTMPRQVQIVQSIFACFSQFMSWKGVESRVKDLDRIKDIDGNIERLDKYVSYESIEVESVQESGKENIQLDTFADFTNILRCYDKGRFPLKGRNGSGKSVLMSMLAQKSRERSFYLPAAFSSLSFKNQYFSQKSGGMKLLSAINEIKVLGDVGLVLLDEWDANIDQENTRKLNSVIYELAESKLVIEVRHQKC